MTIWPKNSSSPSILTRFSTASLIDSSRPLCTFTTYQCLLLGGGAGAGSGAGGGGGSVCPSGGCGCFGASGECSDAAGTSGGLRGVGEESGFSTSSAMARTRWGDRLAGGVSYYQGFCSTLLSTS